MDSDPVDRSDPQGIEQEIRRRASVKLNPAESKPASDGKSGCFIATAVYGSESTDEVILLRQFRDECLTRTAAGKVFIRAYNTCGPFLARIISRSNLLRTVARALLVKPAVKFVKSILPEGNY